MTDQEEQKLKDKLAQLKAERVWWHGKADKNYMAYWKAIDEAAKRHSEILAIEKLIDGGKV